MRPGRFGPESVRPAILAAALLVAQQVAGKATRDALFLSNFDVASLPAMMAGAAVVSLLAALVFARGLAVLSPARLLPAALGVSGALFLVEWGIALALPRAAAVAVYLHHAVLGAALLSGFWSLVNERFDPHTAKRAMGAIGAGASLGGVCGGLLTWAAAAVVTIPTMLLALAFTSLLGLRTVLGLRGSPAAAVSEAPSPSASGAGAMLSGLRLIREVPYLRSLALLVALCALSETLLDYVLSAAATASFAKGAPLMSFFALLHGGSGLLALLVQAFLVRSSLQRLGLAGTLAIQPAFTAMGAAVVLAFPRLAAIVALRAGHAVLRNSAFRSSYELLYTPLPSEQKRPTKAIVDVCCDRLGTVVGSGAVVLVLMIATPASTRLLLALSAVSAALALALAPRFHRGYVGALAANLRSGAVTLEPASVLDATTLMTLASFGRAGPARVPGPAAAREPDRPAGGDALMDTIAVLRSGDVERIRRTLAGDLDPRLVSHVIPLLARDELFDVVAGSLRRAAPRSTGQIVDALLDTGQDPVVRRRIPRVLRAVPTQRSAEGLLLGLADERFDVRHRCGQALVRLRAHDARIVVPGEKILEVALREAARAAESGRHLDHVFTLLALLLDREPLEIALRALRSGDEGLRGTALEYLDNVLPPPVREKLWPHLGGAQRPPRSGRSAEQIRDELLRSTASLGPQKLARTSAPRAGD